MAEELVIPTSSDKREKYELLVPQIKALISDETDLIANLANITAVLKSGMGFFWVGFYLVKQNELVLGPFQGPIACTRIRKGKGVCGTSWEQGETLLVPDVDQFPGHIACSSDSRSEIVLPAFDKDEVVLILDVDSNKLNDFDEIDREYLGSIMRLLEGKF
ncbi:GAF domain-containing protein [Fulvivirga sp. M361]|uniref:GAF domain-containing protein n=1 Tax=Fulvivirga sp. M361 TaxID=2594266 RepID=UPI00117A3823|nr:GAF domain-containing protein [Fulvivirga sp. M361]TRX50951.1 GAF domain-containing protein [Fulvivirga sp. M361]